MSRAREHLRSNLIAYVALFFAVAGGAAYALPGKNSVDSGDIRNGQVKSADLRDSNVRSPDIRNGAVSGADVADDALTGADVAEASLLGVDAASISGRRICEANTRFPLNNSTNHVQNGTACTFGEFSITTHCEAGVGDTDTFGVIEVTSSANGGNIAGGTTPNPINAGGSRTLRQTFDSSDNGSAVVSAPHPFTAWRAGGSHVVGQVAVSVNSMPDGSRLCDFAILASG